MDSGHAIKRQTHSHEKLNRFFYHDARRPPPASTSSHCNSPHPPYANVEIGDPRVARLSVLCLFSLINTSPVFCDSAQPSEKSVTTMQTRLGTNNSLMASVRRRQFQPQCSNFSKEGAFMHSQQISRLLPVAATLLQCIKNGSCLRLLHCGAQCCRHQ